MTAICVSLKKQCYDETICVIPQFRAEIQLRCVLLQTDARRNVNDHTRMIYHVLWRQRTVLCRLHMSNKIKCRKNFQKFAKKLSQTLAYCCSRDAQSCIFMTWRCGVIHDVTVT